MKQASVFNEICGVYYMIRSSYASKYIALPWYAHFYGINLKPVPLFGNDIFLDVGSFIKKKKDIFKRAVVVIVFVLIVNIMPID